MCIVALAWQVIENMPLFLISNRDEFKQRTSEAVHFWQEQQFYAGKDCEQGGTWLGASPSGRWAVLTNYREVNQPKYETSRGELIPWYLQSTCSPLHFAKQLQTTQQAYAGFNLIVGDQQQAVYMSNRGEAPQCLAHGVYVLSNTLMSQHWHKKEHLRKRFSQELLPLLQQKNHPESFTQPATLMASIQPCVWDILQDARQHDEHLLPDTGVGMAWEKQLSSIFIDTPDYGTRCSNVLFFQHQQLFWQEKSYLDTGEHDVRIQQVMA